jgi:S1-C subfamily serine protease
MKSFSKPIIVAAALVVLSCFVTGCVSAIDQGIPADSPTYLRSEARELLNKKPEELYVVTKSTIVQMSGHTRMIYDVAQKAKQAVVSIYVKSSSPYRVSLLPIRLPLTSFTVNLPGTGLGSGFFVHPSGYILTNNHVIRGASQIRGLMRDGSDIRLVVVARDPAYDMALLKVVSSEKKEFPALPMGDSTVVGAGDLVIAIGNPLGLGHTVTQGIISRTGRDLSGVGKMEAAKIRFIQTDAAINPGSSGGPLLTLSGAWVGVNTAGADKAQAIGFAVPSSQAKDFLNRVLKGQGESERAPR